MEPLEHHEDDKNKNLWKRQGQLQHLSHFYDCRYNFAHMPLFPLIPPPPEWSKSSLESRPPPLAPREAPRPEMHMGLRLKHTAI